METDRETQLLKQSVIVYMYKRDLYTNFLKNLNMNKAKCSVFNKTIIPLTLVGYELMIADSVFSTSSVKRTGHENKEGKNKDP